VPALDAIISRFGTDAVAEITGRTRRLVTLPDGSQRLESRTANQSLADANAFMGGAKRILVFSMRAARALLPRQPRCQEPAAPDALPAGAGLAG
jgi:hypothetical protein